MTTDQPPEGVTPTEPVIPWRRVTFVHVVVSMVVSLTPGLLVAAGVGGFLPAALIVAFAVTIVAGIPPLVAAWLAHRIVVRNGRRLGRELIAVVVGAMIGAIVPMLVLALIRVSLDVTAIFAAVVGAGSAIGFAIWVLVAWRHGAQTPAKPLN